MFRVDVTSSWQNGDAPIHAFDLYKLVAHKKRPFFLDSGMDPERLGRYSFIGAEPFAFLQAKNGWMTMDDDGVFTNIQGDPFDLLNQLMKKYETTAEIDSQGIPFCGGAVGYLGYDLRHHVERLSKKAVDDIGVPDLMMGFYDGCIAVDHLENRIYLLDSEARPGAAERIEKLKAMLEKASCKGTDLDIRESQDPPIEQNPLNEPEWRSNFTKSDYLKALTQVRNYIRTGDIYQMNMTQRFEAEFKQDPLAFYEKLRTINPAPFAAYLDYESFQIASCSPERFLQIRNRKVETRPIKGTRPRGTNPQMDLENRKELEVSEKDRSELLMIVDLERNDLGRVSKTGTVKVPELFVVEAYPTVFHLVSTVTGELEDAYSTVDCIKLAFPGGSITGAPKIRAMEIIDELEPTTRNIYTGSIGYIGFNGDADLNIVIRTLLIKDQKAWFQTGGGIVWDSVEEQEYDETFHKARALMKALGINTDFISHRL